MTGIKFAAATAVVSGSSSMVLASQQLLSPDATLVSLGVLVAIVMLAITTTTVVLQFVFKVDRKLDDLDRRVGELEDR